MVDLVGELKQSWGHQPLSPTQSLWERANSQTRSRVIFNPKDAACLNQYPQARRPCQSSMTPSRYQNAVASHHHSLETRVGLWGVFLHMLTCSSSHGFCEDGVEALCSMPFSLGLSEM